MTTKTYTKQSFPWGLYHRNGHRLLFPDGKIRAAELAPTADTFFSVPASARVKGKRVSGYMSCEDCEGERVFCFRPFDYSKNREVLPSWPTETEKVEAFIKSALKETK